MGKGDKKTRRGKIVMGSYGKTRPHKAKKKVELATTAKPTTEKAAKIKVGEGNSTTPRK